MAQKTENKELRWLFLREFTKQLITNSTPIEIQETPEPEPIQDTNLIQEDIGKIPQASPFQGMVASPKTKILENIMPLPKRPQPIKMVAVRAPQGMMDIGKLNLFLRDPRINQIEVNGPEREVLVRISGSPQRTRVKLTKEEIEKIIRSFSEKTRIPLIKGVFKAAVGELVLTAVISDFVDTRFTIQKRRPFQQPTY